MAAALAAGHIEEVAAALALELVRHHKRLEDSPREECPDAATAPR